MATANNIPGYSEENEIASEKHGGKIVFATDDLFAVAENLLKDEEPVNIDEAFTEFGKWMDGWETRRKRIAGHDWAIISLSKRSVITGFCIDTAYFTANFPPKVTIQAALLNDEEIKLFPERHSEMGTAASDSELKQISHLQSEKWETIVPMTELGPGYPESRKHYIRVNSGKSWNYLRLNLYPDGGIARLRVFGFARTEQFQSIGQGKHIDLVCVENGGVCQGFSSARYAHPRNMIKPNKSLKFGDGWETSRLPGRPPIIEIDNNGFVKGPQCDWAILRLGSVGKIDSIIIETTHFKGNFPDNAVVEGTLCLSDTIPDTNEQIWQIILPTKKLSGDSQHIYQLEDLNWCGPVSHVRLTIAPDGGIARFRVLGYKQF